MASLIIAGNSSGSITIAAPAVAGSGTLTLPVATDTLCGIAATQTLTNKTITAPVLSGSATGTYTLAGTPTITAPILSGSATGTYTLAGTPTISSPVLNTPTISGYIETVVAIGTVTSAFTLVITAGTVLTATLTSATACTFTMPAASAGKSFILLLKQPAAGTATTATFTGVKYGTAGAPVITAFVGRMDILTFVSDGTNWYGSAAQGYTP